ncbi:ParB/RepB/Spo0J family partition protein [Flavobacterium sp. RNTU_13]|uniref:ParB/RepB/Spo0J family partition protein n=1 Tax=Flavobacterium sp. RNTU_13 TaxID=3375145 RepID=UPI0039871F62
MTNLSSIIEYDKKVQDINIEQLITNEFNPRARYNEEEEEELIDSILSKGILNPIIVYYDKQRDKYIILDGERRYRACKKINIKTVPARVLLKEPDLLESLSLMFHIHNVREEWTEFAISMTIRRIVDEMGKNIQNLNSSDMRELSTMTSLSTYKINKYLKFQDYPDSVIQKFLEYEIGPSNEKPDPDILLEMHKPIKDIGQLMPELLKNHNIGEIIDICIDKKDKGVIRNNKEFRLINKTLNAAKDGQIPIDQVKNQIERFFNDINFSPEDLYQSTSQNFYKYQSVLKTSKSLSQLLIDFDFNSLDYESKRNLESELEKLLIKIRSL